MNINWTTSTLPQNTINSNYKEITKSFVDKYTASSSFNLSCIDPYYQDDACISLSLVKGTENQVFEFIGPSKFREKMISFNVTSIKYSEITMTPQPISGATNQSILISIHGKTVINTGTYPIACTFIIKNTDNIPKILHHIIEIFM